MVFYLQTEVFLVVLLLSSVFRAADMKISNESNAAVSPIVVSPSQIFEGNDGQWSTFAMRIGSPSQNVRCLPGTSSTSTLVVIPQGCQPGIADCANLRGRLFSPNASSTWNNIGIYNPGFENTLGYKDAGKFGFDTVGLGYQGSGSPTINRTVLAGVSGHNFWLGVLGLNPQPINFTDLNDPQPSLLSLLKTANHIPSMAYSYTAGAQYRLKKVLGSLVLGGYDASRFQASNISFNFASDQTRDLTVGLQDISTNVTGTTVSLMQNAIDIFIDSSIAELWLPVDVCRAFEATFGLEYDSIAGLYLVNDSLHSDLIHKNPTVTFKIGNTATSDDTTSIDLPYASFDLQAAYPYVKATSARYFPLRKAANSTQYVLGRTFLQESTLIVDYERKNFSVNPCVWNSQSPEHIIAIPSKESTGKASTPLAEDTATIPPMSIKTITGIAIGTTVALSAFSFLLYFFIIRPRLKSKYEPRPPKDGTVESGGSEKSYIPEVEGQLKFTHFEAHGDSSFNPASTSFKIELSADSPPKEMLSREIFELRGCDVPELGEGRGGSSPHPHFYVRRLSKNDERQHTLHDDGS